MQKRHLWHSILQNDDSDDHVFLEIDFKREHPDDQLLGRVGTVEQEYHANIIESHGKYMHIIFILMENLVLCKNLIHLLYMMVQILL